MCGEELQILETTTNNLQDLLKPGSLDFLKEELNIPRTIRDAMIFSLDPGIQYLWVDRLCIVQDDQIHLENQIAQMASIYKNAHLTIIAAEGTDVNYGLHGVGTSPRQYHQTILHIAPSLQLLQADNKSDDDEGLYEERHFPWRTRAWTFQERAVSKRAVVFHNETVYW
jgi:hypothetical protein